MKRMIVGLSLALMAAPAGAAGAAGASTVVEDIGIGFGTGTIGQTSFAPFDVRLGQLEEETILLSGFAEFSGFLPPFQSFSVLVYDPTFPGGQFTPRDAFGTAYDLNPAGVPISIDWSFEAYNGLITDSLDFLTLVDGPFSVNPGDLSGEVIYSYSPAVPEPSSWALMLVGFFGLGGYWLRRARLV